MPLIQCGYKRLKVTFYDTLASIAEAVPFRRIPDGVESLVDRLALPQPEIEFHLLGLLRFRIDSVRQ
jgi:hypothetical protein